MSLTLKIFNLFMRAFSGHGIGKLHLAEDITAGFVQHARKMDAIISLVVSKKFTHPLLETDRTHWVWVGDPNKTHRHILYIHGGGFAVHLPSTYRYWADQLATMNDASVLLIDYPLAPDNPFPEGLNDCLDAYRWMVETQNIDADSIIIGGDSAGGNLAIATLLKIKEAQLPYPACTFALSPTLDLTLESPSITNNEKTDVFAKPLFLKRVAELYVPSGDYKNCMVSPMFGDFSGLTPIQLHASRTELLCDESVRFYEKFKNDMPLEIKLWDHVPHCHQIFGFLPESKVARKEIQSFISRHT